MMTEIIKKMVYPLNNVIYRFNQGRKKNLSLNQVIQVISNVKMVYQIFNNFAEMYGSRLKAIQKINKLFIPQYETVQ
jgi:hypothetical protein